MTAEIIPFPGRPKAKPDEYFGVCPDCGKNDGYSNIGKDHWFFCLEHDVKWFVGTNLFSTWRDETEEEQQQAEEWLSQYEIIEPVYLPPEGDAA